MTLTTAVVLRPSIRRLLVPLSATILVIVFVVTFWWARQSNLLTVSGGSTHPYTALFFARPKDLPSTVQAGQTFTIPFSLTNREASDKTYHYTVTIQDADGKSISSSSISVAKGATYTKGISVVMATPATSATITVQLSDQQQLIQHKVVVR